MDGWIGRSNWLREAVEPIDGVVLAKVGHGPRPEERLQHADRLLEAAYRLARLVEVEAPASAKSWGRNPAPRPSSKRPP